jgi:hypothetical protein
MKINPNIKTIAKKKALQSDCNYRVSAIAINRRGEIINTSTNRHRFEGKGRGLHAEMQLMAANPKGIKHIIICRVGKGGCLLPIDPCPMCQEKADELGIKITSIKGTDNG